MIRRFWFSPDVCDAMNNHDETLSICMTSVTEYMQREAARHGYVTPDYEKFDQTVCRITLEAIASLNPHLRKVLAICVNRAGSEEHGDVEVRLATTFYNLIANNPGLGHHH